MQYTQFGSHYRSEVLVTQLPHNPGSAAMEGLLSILRAAHARSTHHRFALDALDHVQTEAGSRLARMLLRYHKHYLSGAKDPDTRFRDFQNHVVHVADNHWGGAPRAAERWYGRLQQFLRQQAWSDAAHAAGVLSHYFTDPLQPLHTAQSEREAVVHRPLEWSIWLCYSDILRRWNEAHFQVVFQLSNRSDWLTAAIHRGAEIAHRAYDTLVNTYDLEAARRDPRHGLGETSREHLAELFAVAITGWARILERTACEAEENLPAVSLGGTTLAAMLSVPRALLLRRFTNREEREQVATLLDHYTATGNLAPYEPEEVYLVRRVLEVRSRERQHQEKLTRQRQERAALLTSPAVTDLGLSSRAETAAATVEESSSPILAGRILHRLTLASPIVDAPSIGPKTGLRLERVGIANIGQFLGASPEDLVQRVRMRWITVEQVADWQAQTRLLMALPWLRVRDVQLLVSIGCRSPQWLETIEADVLHDKLSQFVASSAGKRILRGALPPDRNECQLWVERAKRSAMQHVQTRAA